MKKKALSLILAGAMALSMSACGGNGGETTAAPTEKATSAPTEESGKEEAGEESKEESTQALYGGNLPAGSARRFGRGYPGL